MPNQRTNSGTQAIEGMARSACKVGSSKPLRHRQNSRGESGASAKVPATTPMPKPAATRRPRHDDMALQLAGLPKLHEGLEDHRWRRHQAAVGETLSRTASSHSTAGGSRQDQAERRPQPARQARSRPKSFCCSGLACAAAIVMDTKDIPTPGAWRSRCIPGARPLIAPTG